MAKKTQKKGKTKMGADPLAFFKAKQVKTHPRADTAFASVVYRLKERPELRWRGKAVTREAVYAAVSLWLADMEVDRIAEAMAIYLPRLEQLMLGKEPKEKGVRVELEPPRETTPGGPTDNIGGHPGDPGASSSKPGEEKAKQKPRRKSQG